LYDPPVPFTNNQAEVRFVGQKPHTPACGGLALGP
jgi:hypothetical protein